MVHVSARNVITRFSSPNRVPCFQILTADGDVVVTVLEVSAATAVLEGTGLVQAVPGAGLAESTEALAVIRVAGLVAVGVHPELGGSSVEVDGDGLRGGTDLQVDGVEETGLAVRESALLLALDVLIESLLVDLDGESDKATLLNKVVLVEELKGAGDQRQGRDRKNRTHGDFFFFLKSTTPA